ncbi:hypothetical protein D7X99_11380 [Corallococcus sp. AB032C]|uniref:peptidoglycan-binding domain-containing protein n=1 Tax=Corallococcus TaxID=83461 RepID=UPI000EC38199|nr:MULTISPECIES: peptidoglycan-binding domain-containing protein [Corallococcus]NPC46252.1 peptidoglycan-binding protein [Corallococcus exiguus]RKH83923.1 hypothetical protein D7X99_11380 [Corallococcus sp. AB032C]
MLDKPKKSGTKPFPIPIGYREAPTLEEVRTKNLRISAGQAGWAVKSIQESLARSGFLPPFTSAGKSSFDGLYTKELKSAVTRFQESRKLRERDAVGPETLSELRLELAPDILTPGGTRIFAIKNEDYAPIHTKQILTPKDQKILPYLAGNSALVTKDQQELKTTLINLPNHQKFKTTLKKYKINNIREITPKQSAYLSQEVAAFTLNWLDTKGTGRKLSDTLASDSLSMSSMIAQALSNEPVEAACRNFAEAAESVFEGLKAIQQQSTSMLSNTYCIQNSGGGHRTCAIMTVLPGGDIAATIIDPGWNESNVNRGIPLNDYTFATAYDDPAASVRWAYMAINVCAHTGDKRLADFEKWLKKKDHYSTGELSAALDALPVNSRANALKFLTMDSQRELIKFRSKNNLHEFYFNQKFSLTSPLLYHGGDGVTRRDAAEKEYRTKIGCN